MSLTAAQVLFAAEFLTLVVTASALALLVFQPARRPVQTGAAVVALAALGTVSFLHGALLVSGGGARWLGAARVAAGILAAAALLRRRPAPIGAILWAAAGAAEIPRGSQYPADGLLLAGSLLVAASFLGAGRRSVAVRVAAGAATSLLLVVVVLALALSSVISDSAQRSELDSLASRAQVERSVLTDTTTVALPARLVEADLADYSGASPNPLVSFASGQGAARAAAAAAIAARLAGLSPGQEGVQISYTNADGTEAVEPGDPLPVSRPGGFTREPGLAPPSCRTGSQGLFSSGSGVELAASSPVCVQGGGAVGAVVAALPLDLRYAGRRQAVDPSEGLVVLFGGTPVASAGISAAAAESVSRSVGSPVSVVARAVGDRYAAATTLPVAGTAQRLEILVTSSLGAVVSSRDQLFRTLFLIAFGGTIIALGLAVFTGDRITAGLRRLTGVAASIQAGDTDVRAAVRGSDEIAVLGNAFDAMLDAVVSQAAALRTAASDEARLRNRLEAVVAGIDDGLVAVDTEGRITDFNRAAAAMTGLGAADALGHFADRVLMLATDGGRPARRPFYQQTSRRGPVVGQLSGPAGAIPVAVSSGPLKGPAGEPAGAVLLFRDLRKELEVERMKSEFLSRVGHELRTPLTGILGYADILLRRRLAPGRAAGFHEEILRSARRLLRIVEMLEFFASDAAGRLVLRPEEMDVRAVAAAVADGWEQRLPPGTELVRRLGRRRVVVAADRRWISLALDELIDNAVKFSPDGGRVVLTLSDAGGRVELSVSDRGLGMTPEQQRGIFEDFTQGDASDTRRFGGLGLGLAIARRVVEGHGATISCHSATGKGTTVTIQFPPTPVNGRRPARSPTRSTTGS